MRRFGSSGWHAPLPIASLAALAVASLAFVSARIIVIFELPVLVVITFVLVWHECRIYLPRRSTAGSSARMAIWWDIAVLIWCAVDALILSRSQHAVNHLTWIELMLVMVRGDLSDVRPFAQAEASKIAVELGPHMKDVWR